MGDFIASIVIPTWNRADVLRETLASVASLHELSSLCAEVIVINNNSPDHTQETVDELARDYPVQLRHVVEKRQGLNHGRNRALREAQSEVVVYLDDDVIVSKDWLQGCEEAFTSFDADCVVGPVSPLYECDPPDWFNERVLRSIDSYYSRKGDAAHVLPTELSNQLPGCNFAVSKSVAVDAGGFSPSLDRSGSGLLAGGDIEFGYRLRRAGKCVVYHPACAIQHVIPGEKLDPVYLRRRWSGLGATERALRAMHPWASTIRSPARHLRLLVHYAGRLVRALVRGDRAEVFQRELEIRCSFSYLLTRHCERTREA